MAGRIEQPAPLKLTLYLNQQVAALAEQGQRYGLIIDAGHGFAGAAQLARQDNLSLTGDASLFEQGGCVMRQVNLKACGDHRPLAACADKAKISPAAQCQPQRIQQNGLARPGFAGQHRQPLAKFQRQFFYQQDVADRQVREHNG